MTMVTEGDIELYTQGSCHIFAAACVISHGGHFLVASDAGKNHHEFDDGEIMHEVIHVFAVLPDPGGGEPFTRDVKRDRRLSFSDLQRETEEDYGVAREDVLLDEIGAAEMHLLVSDESGILAGALEIEALFDGMEHAHRPLHEIFPGDIEEAGRLDAVSAPPGAWSLPMEAGPPEPGYP